MTQETEEFCADNQKISLKTCYNKLRKETAASIELQWLKKTKVHNINTKGTVEG